MRFIVLLLGLCAQPVFAQQHREYATSCETVERFLCGITEIETRDVVVPIVYDMATFVHSGIASVQLDGLWGYFNTITKQEIQPQFTLGGPFHFGRAEVVQGGFAGVIDDHGNFVLSAKYARAFPITPDVFLVESGHWRPEFVQQSDRLFRTNFTPEAKAGLVDTSGNWLFPAQYGAAFEVFDTSARGLIWRRGGEKNLFGLFSVGTRSWQIPPQFTSVTELDFDGFAKVIAPEPHAFGLIGREGSLFMGQMFWDVRATPAQVMEYGVWYDVLANGELVRAMPERETRQFASDFRGEIEGSINLISCPDGRAIFRQGYAGHYGIVEPNGKIIIPARYAALSCFNYDNISWVAIEGEGHWCPFGEDGGAVG